MPQGSLKGEAALSFSQSPVSDSQHTTRVNESGGSSPAGVVPVAGLV
jgi:hypothetical protein